jgi:translocation and assembly module TamB
MTRRKKLALIASGCLFAFALLSLIGVLIAIQTPSFSRYAKGKLASIIEESTGGKAEIGSLNIDLGHLTIRIRDFILHGKEPRQAAPLLSVQLLSVRVKLFSSLSNIVDLQFLGVDHPSLNIITLPGGGTNIPEPKTQSAPSQTSGLETVVNLAIKHFEINNGSIHILDHEKALSGSGDNLRAILNYRPSKPDYSGNIAFDAISIRSKKRPPFSIRVNIPLILEKDAIRIQQASLRSPESSINLNLDLDHLKAPVIRTNLNIRVSVPEIQRSFGLPEGATKPASPRELQAKFAVDVDEAQNTVRINQAQLNLGGTVFQANNEGTDGKVTAFNGTFALAELLNLMNITDPRVAGDLQAKGTAHFDLKGNYAVDGRLNSRALSVKTASADVSNLALASPFHADPFLVSLDGLRLDAFGGSVAVKLFIERLANLSVEARLKNFSLPSLVSSLTGKPLGYDGIASGLVTAKGNLKSPGTTGYSATAHLDVVPGRRGIPLSGRIYGTFSGPGSVIKLEQSYLALPNTRLNVNGVLDKQLDITFLSENLNELLPAANFGSKQPLAELPITLQNGRARIDARVLGSLANPHIGARAEITDFSVEQRPFSRVALNLAGSPAGVKIADGELNGKGLNSTFNGSLGLTRWAPIPSSPVTFNLDLQNADLGALVALSGSSGLQASGTADTHVHVDGTYGNPLGYATAKITNGSLNKQPFSQFLLDVNLADQLVTLKQLEIDTAGGRVRSSGTFQHPRESFLKGHAQAQLNVDDIQLAAINAIANQNAGVAGQIRLTASATGDLDQRNNKSAFALSTVNADLAGTELKIQNQDAGSLSAQARTRNGNVNYNLTSDFAGSGVHVQGNTLLSNDYLTTAQASIRDLSLKKTLQLVGSGDLPIEGMLTADANLKGTLSSPNADLQFGVSKGNVYQEVVNGFRGRLKYSSQNLEISNIDLDSPAGSIRLSGSFDHPANAYDTGSLTLKLSSTDIALDHIEHVKQQKPGLGGTVHLAADVAGHLRNDGGKSHVLFSRLNADMALAGVHLNQQQFGGMSFKANTTGQTLNFQVHSDFAESQISGSGEAHLAGDYPLKGNLTFANLRYSNFAPLISEVGAGPAPFETLVEGRATFDGPMTNPDLLAGQLQLDRFDFQTRAVSETGGPTGRSVKLQNKGPMVIALDHRAIQIKQFEISGRNTLIKAAGEVNFADPNEPLGLNLLANLDLGLLQDADRDFYSSGTVDLNASLRGSFSAPRANGRLSLKNANINYAQAPNGISNANGVIVLNGTNAAIESLSGESGGGKVNMTGFVGLGTRIPSFNLKAVATKVRVRYSGLSVTSNATISLIGNMRRSLLSGTVSIERLTYASSSDAGSLLTAASTPPTTPASPSPFLTGMRLAIRVVTAPDIQVISTYANRFSVLANLTARGTAETPGLLGRVTVTDGQLVFFGNTYTVTTGTVNFYDPNAIAPVLNVSLETVAQGVNVTIGVTGPMDDLKLNYRSDPPLTFEQIVQLLATNTTPANPVIAAHQPTPPSQSLSQMGESAVLGQAVANPLASRVQRVFGLSQLKIDPSFTGSNGQPSARVTLQEKVTSNITFTYITDVTQTNSQIVRVQWDLTNNLSAVGLRDYNGAVSIEFFYKFTRR